jgi:hypothetical protein
MDFVIHNSVDPATDPGRCAQEVRSRLRKARGSALASDLP